MNWNKLESIENLEDLIQKSQDSPIVLFKHSTRCPISSMAMNRIKSGIENIDFYYLDIITYRELSNEVARRFNVVHQSPQLLLIHNGECVFNTSHMEISIPTVENQVALLL